MLGVWSGKVPLAAEWGPGREACPQAGEVIQAGDVRPRMGRWRGVVGRRCGRERNTQELASRCLAQGRCAVNLCCPVEGLDMSF